MCIRDSRRAVRGTPRRKARRWWSAARQGRRWRIGSQFSTEGKIWYLIRSLHLFIVESAAYYLISATTIYEAMCHYIIPILFHAFIRAYMRLSVEYAFIRALLMTWIGKIIDRACARTFHCCPTFSTVILSTASLTAGQKISLDFYNFRLICELCRQEI